MSGSITPLGVVLAAGQSRRMGRDKAWVTLGGITLIDRVLCRLSHQLDDIIVNIRCDAVKGDLAYPLVEDRLPFVGLGPLSGLYAALHFLSVIDRRYDAIITVAVDTPFFPSDYVVRLCERAALYPQRALIAASHGVVHPTFALWPCGILDLLNQHLAKGDYSVLSFARQVGVKYVDFPSTQKGVEDAFFNINRAEDLQLAQIYWEEKR